MALGPNQTADPRARALAAAEGLIDDAIRGARGVSVQVPAARLGVTEAEWRARLRPHYLAAGWAGAEWVDGRAGAFIDLYRG